MTTGLIHCLLPPPPLNFLISQWRYRNTICNNCTVFRRCVAQRWRQFPRLYEHVRDRVVERAGAVDVSGRRQDVLHSGRAALSVWRPEVQRRVHLVDVSRPQAQRHVQRQRTPGDLLHAEKPGVVRRQGDCPATGKGWRTVLLCIVTCLMRNIIIIITIIIIIIIIKSFCSAPITCWT